MAELRRVEGGAKIVASLRALSAEIGTATVSKTLKELLAPVAEEIASRAPEDTGKLAESIGVVPLRTDSAGVVSYAITPRRGAQFNYHGALAHLHEWGTKKMAAHPFIRPVWDARSPGLVAKFGESIWARLKQIVGRRR